MEEYKSKERILAKQYFRGVEIEGVKIGVSSKTDRFDDTPDGPYVQVEEFKIKVDEGDWIIKRKNSKYLAVMTDVNFRRMYKLPKKSKK